MRLDLCTYGHKCLSVCAYMYGQIMHMTRDISTYIYAYKDVIKLTWLLTRYENRRMNQNNVNEMNEN